MSEMKLPVEPKFPSRPPIPSANGATPIHHRPAIQPHAIHHDSAAAALALAEAEKERTLEKEKQKWHRTELYVVGRLLLAIPLLVGGIAKLASFAATKQAMFDFGFMDAGILLGAAITVELVGGTMLALGYKSRIAAVGLIVYIAGVTLLVHHDLTIDLHRAFALTNLAFSGGLFMIIAHGSGILSLDRLLEHLRSRRFAD